MADGRVNIDTRLETGNIRRDVQQVNNELGRIGNNMGRTAQGMRNEMGRGMQGMVGDSEHYARQYRRAYGDEIGGLMGDIGGSYRNMSTEARGMMMEMQQGFHAQRMVMLPFQEDQIKATYGFYQMAQGSKDFQGTNQAFIGQANEIGKAMKASQDAQINGNRLAMMGMLETIGAMNAMSSLASKTTKNLDAMKNPLYNTARPALALVDSLDQVARSGSAAQIALELHGPQASMKTLTDEAMRLNSVMMGMPILAMGVGMSMMFMYGGLHKANMEMDPKYAETFKNMLEKITKALEPMRQAFTAVMVPIYKFITKLAELTIAFNQAHPVMARFIQGTIMLVPALMALMLPLALGVGYFRGLRAILFALRPLIMPVATAFATLSAPVWITAAAIAGLTVGLTHFYKTNEKFKSFVDGTVKSLVNFSKALYQNGVDLVKAAYNSDLVQNSIKSMQTALTTAGTKTMEFGSNVLSLGKYLAFAAIDGDHFNDWITHLPDSWQNAAMAMGQSVVNMRSSIVSMFPVLQGLGKGFMDLAGYLWHVLNTGEVMNGWLNGMSGGFQNVAIFLGTAIETMKSHISSFVETVKLALGGDASAIGQVFATILPTLIGMLLGGFPALLIIASRFLPTIVEGINTMLPMLTTAITNIITGVVTLITTYLPQFITKGVEILTMLIEGLVQALPLVIQAIITTMTSMINMMVSTITTLLPVILNAGVTLLMVVLNGFVQNLPAIIQAVIQVINVLLDAIVTLLPQIIDAGIKILMSLIDGIIKMLPQIIDCVLTVITAFIRVVIDNLPQILDAGIKILMALIDGIIQITPKLLESIGKIIIDLLKKLWDSLPQFLDAGAKILTELCVGVISIIPRMLGIWDNDLMRKIHTIVSTYFKIIVDFVKGALKNIEIIFSTAFKIVSEVVRVAFELVKGSFNNFMIVAQGLIRMVKQLFEGDWRGAFNTAKQIATDIMKNIVNTFKNIDLVQTGKNIIQGLINGIKGMAGNAVNTVKNIASDIKSGIADFFDIHSPSRVMRDEIGHHIITGLINGMEGMTKTAVKQAVSMAEQIYNGFSALTEDIVMGDVVEGGGINNAALQSSFANSKRFVNDLVKVNPVAQQTGYNTPKQEQQVKTAAKEDTQSNQGNTYIVLDKKVVGEALAQPVESTNNRRKQRLAQFKPTVTPSF